jgi:copper chaperone CopZ
MLPHQCKLRSSHSASCHLNFNRINLANGPDLLLHLKNRCQLQIFQSQAPSLSPPHLGRFSSWKSRRLNMPVKALIATIEAEPPGILESDVVLLTVQNMKCGGCSGAVKRMLLKDPSIEKAAVNLLTGTAVIEIKKGAIREETVSRALATLTTKGFPTSIRQPSDTDVNLLVESRLTIDAQEKWVE